jgi:hypothetical protein
MSAPMRTLAVSQAFAGRTAPERVGAAHLSDQLANLTIR